MPLDGHAYLVAQGWAGKGSGLREGAISRPLAIAQKKTLSGLGKDRDEAFPFWDQLSRYIFIPKGVYCTDLLVGDSLFSAASTSIKIKIADSDDESDDIIVAKETTVFKRTGTGILCNRRPLLGTPATSSGSTTPSISAESSAASNASLLTLAKREAAKKGLYSRFFRGPVLGPEDGLVSEDKEEEDTKEGCGSGEITPEPETEGAGGERKRKRRKGPEREGDEGDEGGAGEGTEQGTSSCSAGVVGDVGEREKSERKRAKLERKRAREARRQAKEERRKARELRKQEEEMQVEETRAAKVLRKGKRKESTQQHVVVSHGADGPQETGREQKTKKRKKKRDAGDDLEDIKGADGVTKPLVSPSLVEHDSSASKPKKKRKRDSDQ
ncbi:hypothetical protein PC9H_010526 [Pleurotus ostreatus]|uniref:Uncharacterized protein n=1 Tax=Pleurotus ostreatus TaxID=5322 RepID=A0A8H7DPT8_PLEOS|nr:uncharacterized protein PC9H_010526 [Pleurotus ostreatus]KAF7422370.1 hypothetical protein PC9H_010526 [Pleurotus ostreatus]